MHSMLFIFLQVSIKEFGTQFEFARLKLLHVRSLKKTKASKRSKGGAAVPENDPETNNATDTQSKSKTENKVKVYFTTIV